VPLESPVWRDAATTFNGRIAADGLMAWTGDPTQAIDVSFCAFGGSPLRAHRQHFFEIICLDDGALRCQVGDRLLTAIAGDLIIVNGRLPHTFRPLQSSRVEPPRAVVVSFQPDEIYTSESIDAASWYLLPFLARDSASVAIVPAQTGVPAAIRDLAARLAGELPVRSTGARVATRTYLKMMLVLLANHLVVRPAAAAALTRTQRTRTRLQPLLAHIDAHLDEPLSLADAAARVALSRPQFTRVFRDAMGQSFVDYLNRRRIEQAQELLRSTPHGIADICRRVGFASQSYFGLVFRRLVHMTPREFRRRAARPLA